MRIIRSLGVASAEELEKIRKFSEEELEVYLHDILKGKSYLVVVDDIWEREAWESLKRALPCNHGGGRVIITTRIRAVAEGVDGRVYAHKLRFLSFEESWKLFEQKAFRNIQCVDEDLLKIGKEMVQKCSGLPLAIVVLAGLLSRKRTNEWHEVCASLWRRLKDDSIHISTVFDLSFKELRHDLKLCFLYLSVFPEDYEIDVEMLIHLLVAEGFIQDNEEMMMEDTVRHYIEELIDRSLLQAERIERGRVISCKIHDLLRDVAIKKAKELNFVNVYNEQHSSTICRRQVVHHVMYDDSLGDSRVNKRMRSFLFFGGLKGIPMNFVKGITLKLKLLRVLNLEGLVYIPQVRLMSDIPLSLPNVIGELIHLRYLGIADTDISNLPFFISNLQLLQTLYAFGNIFEETTDLRKLTSLRHVTGKFTGKLLLGKAVNLQTLKSISSYSWSKLEHEFLTNLRHVEIYDTYISRPLEWASFSKLTNLRVLKMKMVAFTISLCHMDLIFPSLESLTLVRVHLEEDPMPVLQKLPRLEDLVLKNCSYYPGTKMSISAQGFGRLRKLVLLRLRLDELWIEEQAMLSLMKLVLTTTKVRPTKLIIPDRLRAFLILDSYL